MAAPLRTADRRRTPAVRTRAVAARTGAEAAAPLTVVVPGRRRVAWFMVSLTVLVGGVMIGAVLLHTRLAERQLQIDALERSVRDEQEQFDVLRAQRAELRSPTRLAAEATGLGMVPGTETEFIAVDPMVLAITIARTGEVPVGADTELGSNSRMRPLDQFRLVKNVSSEAP
jgi:hypothetical protein